jgi:hypothetical protein
MAWLAGWWSLRATMDWQGMPATVQLLLGPATKNRLWVRCQAKIYGLTIQVWGLGVELSSLPREKSIVSKPWQRRGHDLKTGRNDAEEEQEQELMNWTTEIFVAYMQYPSSTFFLVKRTPKKKLSLAGLHAEDSAHWPQYYKCLQ